MEATRSSKGRGRCQLLPPASTVKDGSRTHWVVLRSVVHPPRLDKFSPRTAACGRSLQDLRHCLASPSKASDRAGKSLPAWRVRTAITAENPRKFVVISVGTSLA